MLTDIFLVIVGWFASVLSFLLPNIHLWPDTVLTGFKYFAQQIAGLNFILPVDGLFTVFSLFITFEIYFLTGKIAVMIINFFRGSGKIEI